MRRFTQLICVILVMTTVFILPISAEASAVPWGSDYFATTYSYLYPTGGTQFQAWIEVTAMRTMDELGASSVTIQRSPNNSSWTDMKTFTKEDYPQLIGENKFGYENYVTYSGTSGYYYRAVVWFYAKKGTGTAEYKYTTDSIYIS